MGGDRGFMTCATDLRPTCYFNGTAGGVDVEREYLGHVHVNETYWYLEAVPEFLQLATKRLVEKAREVTA
jgi:hypothetical protein